MEKTQNDFEIRSIVENAVSTQSVSRSDSANTSIQATRALIRNIVDRAKVSDERKAEVGNALSRGLGLTKVNNKVRSDAYFGDLKHNVGVIEQPSTPFVLANGLPQRHVPAWAQFTEADLVSYEGSVALANGNTTDIPVAGYNASPVVMPVHSFVVRTQVPWQHALYSQGDSGIDAVEQAAKAAKRALFAGLENMIVNGYQGISFSSLATGAIPRVNSPVDFSSASMSDMVNAVIKAAKAAVVASGDAGLPPDTAFIGSGILDALDAQSNYNAGGDVLGSEALRRALAAIGISRVVRTPSLDSKGANCSALFVRTIDGEEGGSLKLVMAMAPAPVKVVESLTATETLWAMRVAGLEMLDLTGVSMLTVKVR